MRQWVERFTERAEAVSARVTEIDAYEQAAGYVLDICENKEACQLLISGCDAPLSPGAEALCDLKRQKTIAAPGLPAEWQDGLSGRCRERGIAFLRDGLRGHLAGIDIGFTLADWGIAETGTLVLRSTDEELRLATMICEIHVALLPVSRIRPTVFELEPLLSEGQRSSPDYTAFITGASRTADIERVLALGVHGPLELHILLLKD